MSGLLSGLSAVLADITAHGHRCALVGGLAVSARAEPRMTRDIDLAVAVTSDREAEGLVASLRARGYDVRALIEQEAVGRLATVRFVRRDIDDLDGLDDLSVDLLFASSGIEAELVDAAEVVEIVPGVAVPLASTGFLMALKLLARDDRHRPQDADDLRQLMAVATEADRAQCQEALGLIMSRGFNRGRDLLKAWQDLSEAPPW